MILWSSQAGLEFQLFTRELCLCRVPHTQIACQVRERLPDGRGNTYDIQARSSISPAFTEIVMEMHLVKPPHYQEVFYVLTQFTQHIGIDTSGFDVFSAIKLTAQLAFGVPDSR